MIAKIILWYLFGVGFCISFLQAARYTSSNKKEASINAIGITMLVTVLFGILAIVT